MDFDGKENPEKCLAEVREAKKILDEAKVPYYILNSSFTGFHIHIPSEFIEPMEINKLIEILNRVIYNFKGVYDLSCLDNSVIDIKRICKVPYSYVCDNSIALPLSDLQLANWKPEMVSMKNVMKNVMLKNRGLKIRTHNLSEEQLKENVRKFISDFE